MKVLVTSSHQGDQFLWVRTKDFMAHVDRHDLSQRASAVVENCYHTHWFGEDPKLGTTFQPPVLSVRNGSIFFINGRHRTVLLGRHTVEMPVVVANVDPLQSGASTASSQALTRITVRKLKWHEAVEIPNLPIRYMGYDANIGV